MKESNFSKKSVSNNQKIQRPVSMIRTPWNFIPTKTLQIEKLLVDTNNY